HHDRRLIQPHKDRGAPVLVELNGVAKAVVPVQVFSIIPVVVLKCAHGGVRGVRERCQSAGRCHLAFITVFGGFVGGVVLWSVAGGEAPEVIAIAPVVLRIFDTVPLVDQRDVPVVLEIVGVLVGNKVRI